MNINLIAESMRRITDCANPPGYVLCQCGMTASKKLEGEGKNIIRLCCWCKKKKRYLADLEKAEKNI